MTRTPPESTSRKVSVIIPLWREDPGVLDSVRTIARWPEVREVIVSAADQAAGSAAMFESAGARWVSSLEPSRGRQLNLGADIAQAEWLLFQHADSELTRAHVQALVALSSRSDLVGGAFYRRFDARHPYLRGFEQIERWRNRSFGALYGDQSIFVRRAHFAKLGGFANIPLMEDLEFSRRLRRSGRIQLLDPPIASSPRKHQKRGAWKTTLQNAGLILLYELGVSPARLHSWYYRYQRSADSFCRNP